MKARIRIKRKKPNLRKKIIIAIFLSLLIIFPLLFWAIKQGVITWNWAATCDPKRDINCRCARYTTTTLKRILPYGTSTETIDLYEAQGYSCSRPKHAYGASYTCTKTISQCAEWVSTKPTSTPQPSPTRTSPGLDDEKQFKKNRKCTVSTTYGNCFYSIKDNACKVQKQIITQCTDGTIKRDSILEDCNTCTTSSPTPSPTPTSTYTGYTGTGSTNTNTGSTGADTSNNTSSSDGTTSDGQTVTADPVNDATTPTPTPTDTPIPATNDTATPTPTPQTTQTDTTVGSPADGGDNITDNTYYYSTVPNTGIVDATVTIAPIISVGVIIYLVTHSARSKELPLKIINEQ